MIISKKISFDAAHRLPNYDGKCANLHGHHWIVELAVRGEVSKETGMVVDFTLLKEFLESIRNTFDHHLVNEIIENPTAENICKYIFNRYWSGDCKLPILLSLEFIRVWETEDSYAELRN